MYRKILLATSVATLLFTGCSSKQYFEPAQSYSLSTVSMGDNIIHYSRDGATLASGTILTKHQVIKTNVERGFHFINNSRDKLIMADLQGNCHILDTQGAVVASAKFPHPLVAGTIIRNNLVYVLQNNSYGIYDLQQKTIRFSQEAQKAYAIDSRIANPLAVDNLVVIPTLDGKLVIVDLNTKKVAKEIYVSTDSSLNNVIYLGQLNNALIAATPKKILSLSAKGKHEFATPISEVTINNGNLFVFAKDGRILKLNETLSVIAEKKFKFAHFSAGAVDNDKVYALDKQGYLIVANRNLSKHKVYTASEVDGFAFISGNKLYHDGEIIDLSQLSYE